MMRISIPIITGIILSLTASASAALQVISDNYYSMLKVQAQTKATPLAIPFVALEAATNSHPISVADAVDVRTLEQGDMLMIYDHANQHFNEYEVQSDNTWAARTMYTLDPSGEVEASIGEPASEMTVMPGYGSWLMRANTNNAIILHGQLPYNATVTVTEGKNLVGSVKLTSTDLNNCGIDWVAKGVKETTRERKGGRIIYEFGDSIVFTPLNSTQMATLYFVKSGANDPSWQSIGIPRVDPVLPAGCACWFIHADEESFTYGMDPADMPADASSGANP